MMEEEIRCDLGEMYNNVKISQVLDIEPGQFMVVW